MFGKSYSMDAIDFKKLGVLELEQDALMNNSAGIIPIIAYTGLFGFSIGASGLTWASLGFASKRLNNAKAFPK